MQRHFWQRCAFQTGPLCHPQDAVPRAMVWGRHVQGSGQKRGWGIHSKMLLHWPVFSGFFWWDGKLSNMITFLLVSWCFEAAVLIPWIFWDLPFICVFVVDLVILGKGREDCLSEATSHNIYFGEWKLNISYILLGAHWGSGTALSTLCKITKWVLTTVLWGTETDEEIQKG